MEINATLVAICVGLTEVVKQAFGLPSKYAPLVSIGVGIVAGLLVIGFTVPAGLIGLISGLAASGLYDVALKPIGK